MSAATTDIDLKKAAVEAEINKGKNTANLIFNSNSIDATNWQEGILFEFDPKSTIAFTKGFNTKMTELEVHGFLSELDQFPTFFAAQTFLNQQNTSKATPTHYVIYIYADGRHEILSPKIKNIMEYMRSRRYNSTNSISSASYTANPTTSSSIAATISTSTVVQSGNSGLQSQFDMHKKKNDAPATSTVNAPVATAAAPIAADNSKLATANPQQK